MRIIFSSRKCHCLVFEHENGVNNFILERTLCEISYVNKIQHMRVFGRRYHCLSYQIRVGRSLSRAVRPHAGGTNVSNFERGL